MEFYYKNLLSNLQTEFTKRKIPTEKQITLITTKFNTYLGNPVHTPAKLYIHKEILEKSQFYIGYTEVTKVTDTIDFTEGEMKFYYEVIDFAFKLIYSIDTEFELVDFNTYKCTAELLNLLDFSDDIKNSIIKQIETTNDVNFIDGRIKRNIWHFEILDYPGYENIIKNMAEYIQNNENIYMETFYKHLIYQTIKSNKWLSYKSIFLMYAPPKFKDFLTFYDKVA